MVGNTNYAIVNLINGNKHLMLVDFTDVLNPNIISLIDATSEGSSEHLVNSAISYVYITT
jgi:hypothetical protein